MLYLCKYKDAEIKQLLSGIVILVDTREQKNNHIIDLFNEHKIEYISTKLDIADYSFMLKKDESLGINRDLYFDNEIAIERKGSLEELSGNFTQDRIRFENELIRSRDMKITLLIENSSIDNLIEHNYKTQLSEKAYFASLLSFQQRYNINTVFIDKKHAWKYIYSTFYYYLKEKFR